MKSKTIPLLAALFCLVLIGCTGYPKDALKLSEKSVERRQAQSRQFETDKEDKILSASAGVLQDMGYTLEESETKLGLIVASKERDATKGGQVFFATMSLLFGGDTKSLKQIDATQKIRASIVTQRSASNQDNVVVRATFQRIVWNSEGGINRMETLDEDELYQGFFEKLSKAVFLEGHSV